jgi:hypothetical protein
VNTNLETYLISENTVDSNGDEVGDGIIDLNGDNEIQLTEALAVQNLVISPNFGTTITSIQDISQFINLKRLTIAGDFGLLTVSNLNLDSLEHIRINDHNSITDIDLSDLPNLKSIIIEGLNGLNTLNIQNGSHATQYFSLFYTYFNAACVDSIAEEYDHVALHILSGDPPMINCTLDIPEKEVKEVQIYPNPFNDEIRIKSKLVLKSYSVFGLDGRQIKKGELVNNRINLMDISSGPYLLVIQTPKGDTLTYKILKNK